MQLLLKRLNAPSNEELLRQYNGMMAVFVPFSLNEQIIKDIKRTYSGMRYFNPQMSEEGFKKLHRLLVAMSGWKKIGYVQGMNFIAASFLWHCQEEYAYFLMVQMFEKLKMQEIYSENLENVEKKAVDFFASVLGFSAVNIFNDLRNKEITPIMILAEWVITLGFSTVPIETHMNIMMGLFEGGWNYLFSVLLRYFRTLYPFFKDHDFADTMQLIKNNGDVRVKQEFGVNLNWETLTKN